MVNIKLITPVYIFRSLRNAFQPLAKTKNRFVKNLLKYTVFFFSRISYMFICSLPSPFSPQRADTDAVQGTNSEPRQRNNFKKQTEELKAQLAAQLAANEKLESEKAILEEKIEDGQMHFEEQRRRNTKLGIRAKIQE